MYNKRSCPNTPAPRKDGPRFPMSAAILETPSIMSSFLGMDTPNQIANAIHPPAPKQFIMSYSSNAPNNPNKCVEKAAINQPGTSFRQNINVSQTLNSSFLDCSFSSNYSTSMSVNRKVPLTSSSIDNQSIKGSYNSCSSTANLTAGGLKNLHRPGPSSGRTKLNDTFHSYAGNTFSVDKRKHSTETTASKYSKSALANIPKGSTATAAIPDSANIYQNTKTTSLRILSGTIEHLQKSIREQGKQHPLLLETVANVVSIKCSPKTKEKVILLRHRNQGPVMQGVFYEIDRNLPPLAPGDLVRCVGRLQSVGSRFQILKISRTTEEYGRAIVRLQTVSAFTSKVRR